MNELRVRRETGDDLDSVSVSNPIPVSIETANPLGIQPAYQSGQLNQGLAAANIPITLKQGNAIRVQLRGNSSYDGTVDFQAIVRGGTWVNCLYVNIQTAGSAPSAAQIASPSTITQYLIFPGAIEYRIAIGAAAAGNIDLWWQEVSVPLLGGVGIVPGTAATNLGKAEDAAHASGDVGVMMLAVRDDTLAAFSGAEGDYEPLHTEANGALPSSARGGSTATTAGDIIIRTVANADDAINTNSNDWNGLRTGSLPYRFNGATFDKDRNVVQTNNYIAASLVSATQNGADRTNYCFKGLAIFVDFITRTGTGTLTVALQLKDGNANYKTIWTAAVALSAVGQAMYLIYPTAENTESWTEMANTALGGRTYRVIVTYGGADTVSFDVDLVEHP